MLDHRAAARPGGHRLEKLTAAPEDAHTGGAVQLVAREGVEVGAQRIDVDGHVGNALGTVDHDGGAYSLGHGRHRLHRQDRAQRVGDL